MSQQNWKRRVCHAASKFEKKTSRHCAWPQPWLRYSLLKTLQSLNSVTKSSVVWCLNVSCMEHWFVQEVEVKANSDVFRALGLWVHDDWWALGDCFVVRGFLHAVVLNKLFNSVLEGFIEMVWNAPWFLGDWYGIFFHWKMNLYLLAISYCLANS